MRWTPIRSALAVCVALACLAIPLKAANLSLFTGPAGSKPTPDFPVGLGTINQLIQDINSGVGGMLNAQTGAVGTGADTTEDVLQTYTLPASTLTAAGQAVRVSCFFSTGATANNKTVKLYFGGTSIATPTYAGNAQTGRLQVVVLRTGTTTLGFFGSGMAGTGSITPVAEVYTAGTGVNWAAGTVIKCTGTNGTAAANDIVANAMITELLK